MALSLIHELVFTEINNYNTSVFHRAKLISKSRTSVTINDLPKFPLLFFPLSLVKNEESIATKKLLIYLFF